MEYDRAFLGPVSHERRQHRIGHVAELVGDPADPPTGRGRDARVVPQGERDGGAMHAGPTRDVVLGGAGGVHGQD